MYLAYIGEQNHFGEIESVLSSTKGVPIVQFSTELPFCIYNKRIFFEFRYIWLFYLNNPGKKISVEFERMFYFTYCYETTNFYPRTLWVEEYRRRCDDICLTTRTSYFIYYCYLYYTFTNSYCNSPRDKKFG